MNLVEKAKKHKRRKVLQREEIDLAIALIRDEITHNQASLALGLNPKTSSTKIYTIIARSMKQLHKEGRLAISLPGEKGKGLIDRLNG